MSKHAFNDELKIIGIYIHYTYTNCSLVPLVFLAQTTKDLLLTGAVTVPLKQGGWLGV